MEPEGDTEAEGGSKVAADHTLGVVDHIPAEVRTHPMADPHPTGLAVDPHSRGVVVVDLLLPIPTLEVVRKAIQMTDLRGELPILLDPNHQSSR